MEEISESTYSFFDKTFISDENKMNLFSNIVNIVKTNENLPHKSAKASVSYVIYNLIKHGVIIDVESLNNEYNKYLNHIFTNFNQYRINLGKYTLSHLFYKFSNNYLLENYNEQIYKLQEIQPES